MACVTYYSNCTVLIIGCILYLDSSGTTVVPNGYYSDGTNCYTVSNGDGEIKAITSC